jgi:hypothetical protein
MKAAPNIESKSDMNVEMSAAPNVESKSDMNVEMKQHSTKCRVERDIGDAPSAMVKNSPSAYCWPVEG